MSEADATTPPPTDDELHALVSRVDSNCFGIYRSGAGEAGGGGRARVDALGRDVDLLGRGVYLAAALFNHSCAPNCCVSAGALRLEVQLLDDESAAPGDELTISYIDTQLPRAARQRLLATHYHFDCGCERCANPPPTDAQLDGWRCAAEGCAGGAVPPGEDGCAVCGARHALRAHMDAYCELREVPCPRCAKMVVVSKLEESRAVRDCFGTPLLDARTFFRLEKRTRNFLS